MSRRTQHVGAGVPLDRLPHFDKPGEAPTPTVLNVLRVALDVADMRGTGFKDFEVAAARAWVNSITPAKKGDKQ